MFRSHHQKILRSCLAAGVCLALQAVESVAAPLADGTEFAAAPTLPGDQTRPALGLNATGGYLVWQDNVTDEDGSGISARRIQAGFTAAGTVFRVNSTGIGQQVTPKVAALPDGGALFVWTSGADPLTEIRGRWISADGTFKGPDFSISTSDSSGKVNPSVAVSGDSVLVSWTSIDLETTMGDVYARRFGLGGAALGSEYKLNQFSSYGQRDASISPVSGGFAAAWVSESQRTAGTVDIYARFLDLEGGPEGAEFLVNSSTNICANPTVSGTASSGALFAWSERAWDAGVNGWDVSARAFRRDSTPLGAVTTVNTTKVGDQMIPRSVVVNNNVLVVWTSMGQDGADEGVYGQVLTPAGQPEGAEFRVNTTTVSRQINPSIGTDGAKAMVVWSSHIGGGASFDLIGQRYGFTADNSVTAPAAPFVASIAPDSLTVSWAESLGGSVDSYLISVDGAAPKNVRGLSVGLQDWSWTAGSSHAVRLAYVLPNGKTSPYSAQTVKKTIGVDSDGNGLPDEWELQALGAIGGRADEDTDGDGATNLQEFLAGTNPKDARSILKTTLIASGQGVLLQWDSMPGNVYQVQATTDFSSWTPISGPRFATSDKDSILLTAPGNIRYYRVILMR